ncbi:hypothetical protein D3C80_1692130 [compost metagenome]
MQAVLHHTDIFENTVHHPHDPAGHIHNTDNQAGRQRDGPDADQRLRPQPQSQTGGADDQQSVQRGDRHVHAGNQTPRQLGFLRLFGDRFAGVFLLKIGMREQFQRGDIGVTVNDAAHQF